MKIFFDTVLFLAMVALILIYTSGWVCFCAFAIFVVNCSRWYFVGLETGESPVYECLDNIPTE